MAEKQFIFWDSCVFIFLLSKHTDQTLVQKQEVCRNCLQEAIDGKVDIYVSTVSIVEINKTIESTSPIPKDVQDKIQKLISQPFVKVVSADLARAYEARSYIWQYSWLKPADAIHLACAIYANVTELFTYDGNGSNKGLLDLDGKLGTPPLKINNPHFNGIQSSFS